MANLRELGLISLRFDENIELISGTCIPSSAGPVNDRAGIGVLGFGAKANNVADQRRRCHQWWANLAAVLPDAIPNQISRIASRLSIFRESANVAPRPRREYGEDSTPMFPAVTPGKRKAFYWHILSRQPAVDGKRNKRRDNVATQRHHTWSRAPDAAW